MCLVLEEAVSFVHVSWVASTFFDSYDMFFLWWQFHTRCMCENVVLVC